MKTLFSAALLGLLPILTQAATLELPSSISVNRVNGEAVPAYRSSVALAPGVQILELRYGELLQPTAEDHEVVGSEPLYLSFEANGDRSYRLILPELRSDDEVRRFARHPRVTLQSGTDRVDSQLLTQSQLLTLVARNSLKP